MERQSLLTKDDAPKLWVIMDETVLKRPVGSPQVMREQADKLLEATELSHVTLQIAEFAPDTTRAPTGRSSSSGSPSPNSPTWSTAST